MTRRLILSLVGVGVLSSTVMAQSLPVSIDQRVRVTTDSVQVGRVVEVSTAGIYIAIDGAPPITIATAAVRKIEVSRGRQSKAKKYAIRGAIISGVIGALSLGLQHDTVGDGGSSTGEAAALGAFSGGLFGGLIGGAIGAAKGTDRWEKVYPD